jgi:hypothetical protein
MRALLYKINGVLPSFAIFFLLIFSFIPIKTHVVEVYSTPNEEDFLAGGDFSLDFTAAAPQTYDHDTGGGAFNNGDNGEDKDRKEELEGGDFSCGDIVSYLQEIVVAGSATDVDQVLELEYSFLANTTGQPGAAHIDVVNIAVNYGPVENGDDGNPINPGAGSYGLDSGIDDDRQTVGGGDTQKGGSSITPMSEMFLPIGSVPFGTPPNDADERVLIFQVDDLDPGERIIVRIDVKLACQPGSSPTGNLQAKLVSAFNVGANGGVIIPPEAAGSGAQTIPFKQIGQLFGNGDALINIQKTVTTVGGPCPGNETLYLTSGTTVKYCYTVTNPGTDPLYDVEVIDDNGTPGDATDDFVVSLTGLTDIDGEGDLGDLVSGGTATGEALIAISSFPGSTVNKAVATGHNGLGGNQNVALMDMDVAEVVICNLTCKTTSGTVVLETDMNGTVSADGLAGNPPYSYLWKKSTEPNIVLGTSSQLTGLGEGTYFVTVTDNLGCTAICSANVTVTGILPVEFGYFMANTRKRDVHLNWSTLSEVNNAGFYVERSSGNSNKWKEVGFVPGYGNSKTVKEYSFTDKSSLKRQRSYYRLRQVDNDGHGFYSGIRTVSLEADADFSVYPNPTKGMLTITIPEDYTDPQIEVYDNLGRIVMKQQLAAGTTSYQIDLSSREEGLYMIRLTNDTETITRMVILTQ